MDGGSGDEGASVGGMQHFGHLTVWRRAHALAIALHQRSRWFPRAGHTNLRNQLVRAVESIPANIVEGCGAASRPEFARFLDIAIKSANEAEYHLLAARDFELLSQEDWLRFTSET